MSTHDIVQSNCPRCNFLFEAATNLEQLDNQPRPGDFSICIRCSLILVLGDDMRVRRPTVEEWGYLAIHQDALALLLKTRTCVQLLRAERN